MKKLLILLLTLTFILCGCQYDNSTASEKEAVKINLPKDNTVNGYRIEEPETDGMPDKISGVEVSPNGNTVSNNTSNETSSKKDISSTNKTTSENKTTTDSSDDKNISFCGNKNSKKFHKSTCGALKNTKDENKIYLDSKDEFLANGYTACKLCNP